jgi:endonuclease/exonuclease/phosphatase family metal-dependent hydrolase
MLALAACDLPAVYCPPPESRRADEDALELRVLSYNIGNLVFDSHYSLRIKDQAYEDHLGERIRSLDADIVGLQEVLPPTACERFEEPNPAHTCFDSESRLAPVQRLLGSSYGIVCDANRHIECIGIHERLGVIRGLEPGGFSLSGAETAPLPHKACSFVAGDCFNWRDTCDAESAVATVVVDTIHGPLRVVHVHPTSTGDVCRQEQVSQAFDFADDLPTILLGDWNFDPTDPADVVETAIWAEHVGPDRRFTNHMPRQAGCALDRVDLVVSDFATGDCRIWNDPRLDDGHDFTSLIGGRADHAAIDCRLHVDERILED